MSLRYEISTDTWLLQQYYRMREAYFRTELGLADFRGEQDALDLRSDLLIARDGNRCAGGTRITGRSPRRPHPVPIEELGFDLAEAVPEIGLSEAAYCQWSRAAIDPDYRTTDMIRDYFCALIETSRSLGYEYSFVVADRNRTRLYRRLCTLAGYRYEVLHDVPVPAEPGFDGLPHLLSVGYLREKCHGGATQDELSAVA
jgi:hypothetical protein